MFNVTAWGNFRNIKFLISQAALNNLRVKGCSSHYYVGYLKFQKAFKSSHMNIRLRERLIRYLAIMINVKYIYYVYPAVVNSPLYPRKKQHNKTNF